MSTNPNIDLLLPCTPEAINKILTGVARGEIPKYEAMRTFVNLRAEYKGEFDNVAMNCLAYFPVCPNDKEDIKSILNSMGPPFAPLNA